LTQDVRDQCSKKNSASARILRRSNEVDHWSL